MCWYWKHVLESKIKEKILNLEGKVEEVNKQLEEMLQFIISRNKYPEILTTMSKSMNNRFVEKRRKAEQRHRHIC